MTALEKFQQVQLLCGVPQTHVDGLRGPETDRYYAALGDAALNEHRGTLPIFDGIVDIYHLEPVDFQKLKDAGIVAIVHKATEGLTIKDKAYHTRKDMAKSMGFLWGSYHFSSGERAIQQAQEYLQYCKPEADELICLDFEPSSSGSDMTIVGAEQFVSEVQWRIGRWPMIYGGSLLREGLRNQINQVLKNCPLWYSRYSNEPKDIPNTWSRYTLWQFTDGDVGPEPHFTSGIGNCDRNRFQGTKEQLIQQWPFT